MGWAKKSRPLLNRPSINKSYQNLRTKLDFQLNLSVEEAQRILQVGIKYSLRDLIRDVIGQCA